MALTIEHMSMEENGLDLSGLSYTADPILEINLVVLIHWNILSVKVMDRIGYPP